MVARCHTDRCPPPIDQPDAPAVPLAIMQVDGKEREIPIAESVTDVLADRRGNPFTLNHVGKRPVYTVGNTIFVLNP